MIQLRSRVGADGVLSLNVPLGTNDANSEVVITIQTMAARQSCLSQKPWLDFLDETYGSCADMPIERASQGECEARETVYFSW
jgi:hypothetical protein